MYDVPGWRVSSRIVVSDQNRYRETMRTVGALAPRYESHHSKRPSPVRPFDQPGAHQVLGTGKASEHFNPPAETAGVQQVAPRLEHAFSHRTRLHPISSNEERART